MGFRYKALSVAVCALFVLEAGCIFKPARYRGVMSYRHGRVFLQYGGFYRVGFLPDGWRRMDIKARAISWYNENYRASISTDAFCGKSFVDRPLDTLAGEMASALSDRTTVSTEEFMLDERGALRLLVVGNMDGVPVNMDVVVVKKDGCNFDFYAIMPPDAPQDVERDFEGFFNGFHY